MLTSCRVLTLFSTGAYTFKLFSGAKIDFLPFLKMQIMCFCTFEITLFSNFRALWKDCSTLSQNGFDWIDGRSVNFSCIGISQTAKSYREASNFCANLNSHLVEIFTETQQEFLKTKLRAKFGNRYMHFWIGVKFNGVNWYWQHSNTGKVVQKIY